MKKFALKLALFALIFAALDFAWGIASDYLFKHTKSGEQAQLKNAAYETTDPVLFMGSSHCANHYIPQIISDSISMDVLNCGRKGNGIVFFYGLLEVILNRYQPGYIAYDIISALDLHEREFDNTRFLKGLRRFYDIPEVKDLFIELDPTEKYKMLSHLRRDNEIPLDLLVSCVKSPKNPEFKGFQPLYGHVNTEVPRVVSNQEHKNDPFKIKCFEKFVKLCKDKGVKLVLFISPSSYTMDLIEPSGYQFFLDYAAENGLIIFNNSYNPNFVGHPELFNDGGHLNYEGAVEYSKIVGQQLKSVIREAD